MLLKHEVKRRWRGQNTIQRWANMQHGSIALSGHQKFPSTSQKCLVFGVETLKKNRMCLGKTVQIMQK